MFDLFVAIFIKILPGLVVGLVAFVAYHAFDIYLAVTRRDYTNIEIMLMYFTRNDHGRSPSRRRDVCQSRLFGPIISIRDTYRNRFLFWSLILKSLRAKPSEPIISFGKDTEMFLRPIRGRIVSSSARDEAKRAEGLPYKEGRYHFCVICDLSDDKRRRVLKVIVMRTADLNDCEKYFANPPAGGDFTLFTKIVEMYRSKPAEHFLNVKITLT